MEEQIEQLRSWIESNRNSGAKAVLDHFCSFLRTNLETYNWVGIYVVSGDKLKLFSYDGEPTEHNEIKIGDGLCSLAIIRNETVNESNVKENTEYLACFPTTESELVVPITFNGKAVGEIDVDSDTKAAFTMRDEQAMSRLAEDLSEIVAGLAE